MTLNTRVDNIHIKDFKRIQNLSIDLKPITALVGGNTSGKSSALMAAQLCISILQASYEQNKSGGFWFATTVSNDEVAFRPTGNILNLRHGTTVTQTQGFEVSISCTQVVDSSEASESSICRLLVRRGKNANLSLKVEQANDLGKILADRNQPFSIFTPGLSGIPLREEWRTRGALDSGAMHGDANLYLRTLLDHLFVDGVPEPKFRSAWKEGAIIGSLPQNSPWRAFSTLLDRCYPGARVVIEHDPARSKYVDIDVRFEGQVMSLDMASTGMLQVIQILAYACFYKPPLLLLDEPDAHLHADSQSRLYEALRSLVIGTGTRILLASHSPQLIQRLMYDPDAAVIWLDKGSRVELDSTKRPAIPILMELGALTIGAQLFDPMIKLILLTEDKILSPVTSLAHANGAKNDLAIISYNGSNNLSGSRQLARLTTDVRRDVKVVIHRDRDFRTLEEMEFEKLNFYICCDQEKIERVTELFTPYNDIEHSFVQLEHLVEIFKAQLSRDDLQYILADVLLECRDEQTGLIRNARSLIDRTLYESERLRKKDSWTQAGLTDSPPKHMKFLPTSGKEPLQISQCHGKSLFRAILPKLHLKIKGSTETLNDRLLSVSTNLKDTEWVKALT